MRGEFRSSTEKEIETLHKQTYPDLSSLKGLAKEIFGLLETSEAVTIPYAEKFALNEARKDEQELISQYCNHGQPVFTTIIKGKKRVRLVVSFNSPEE